MHRNPSDTRLLACGHRGRRYIELVRWPDGEYHIYVAGGKTIHQWSTTLGGLFKGRYSPWEGFRYDLACYMASGSYQHVDEAALSELEAAA